MAAFDLPAATLAVWAAAAVPPATEGDISAIAALTPHPLPEAYVEFLSAHGFVSWLDVDTSQFASPEGGDRLGRMLRAEEMAFIGRSPDFDYPDGVLPIIDDYSGHGLILIRTAPPAGAILHSYDGGPPVEIAPDLATFLSGLTSLADAEPVMVRDTGTLVEDPATGFVIATETRAAWAAYGTGNTPEPEDELAAIEDTLGRPLPEALRSFLTNYGYVAFGNSHFDGAINRFDLPPGAGPASAAVSTIYSTAVLPRALPLAPGAPLPFAMGEGLQGPEELLIGLTEADEGVIYWRPNPDTAPVRVADDLRGLLAALYSETETDG